MATSTIGIANLSQCWISALKSDGLPSWSSLAKQSWPPPGHWTHSAPALHVQPPQQPRSSSISPAKIETQLRFNPYMEELSMTWALTWGDHVEFYGDLPIKTETSLDQTLICWFMATHCQKNVGNVWMWHDLTINDRNLGVSTPGIRWFLGKIFSTMVFPIQYRVETRTCHELLARYKYSK